MAGNLKPCKSCSNEVAKSAKTCPHCGQKLKMGFFKKALIGVAVLFVIGVFASMGNDETATTTPASNNQASAPAETPKQEAPKELSYEGVSSDVTIKILGTDTLDTIGDNQFSQAKAQGVFKVYKISVTNNQKDAVTVDANSYKLVDDQGREFSTSSDARFALASSSQKAESLFLTQINPGITVEGILAYDVPKDAKGLVLKARGGMMGKEITLKAE